jgi:hypothetical protein
MAASGLSVIAVSAPCRGAGCPNADHPNAYVGRFSLVKPAAGAQF